MSSFPYQLCVDTEGYFNLNLPENVIDNPSSIDPLTAKLASAPDLLRLIKFVRFMRFLKLLRVVKLKKILAKVILIFNCKIRLRNYLKQIF